MSGRRVTKEEIDRMNKLYKEGYSLTKIGEILGRPYRTVSKYVDHEPGIKQNFYKRFTDEELQEILDLYADRNWDEIYKRFPELKGKKQKIYTLASNRKVKVNNYFWSQEDTDFLINNYGKISYKKMVLIFNNRYTESAIKTKAIKLGLTEPQDWSEEEIQIMLQFYSNTSKEEFQKMLPKRTENAIVDMARKLGIKSYHYLQEKYSEEQTQFVIDNYEKLSDYEIGEIIGKSARSVMEKRHTLNLYYINKEYQGYENIAKFLRGHLQIWKNDSMEACNYQCIFTGSKDFAIHHTYGFNVILKELFQILDDNGLLHGNDTSDYTKEELDNILIIFNQIHDKYPLGVCVRKDIHNLFHKYYGTGANTIEQWERFENDFRNHKYEDEIEL